MNCCDEYGNCNQGRDCPIRKERVRQAKELLDGKPTPASKQVTWAPAIDRQTATGTSANAAKKSSPHY